MHSFWVLELVQFITGFHVPQPDSAVALPDRIRSPFADSAMHPTAAS